MGIDNEKLLSESINNGLNNNIDVGWCHPHLGVLENDNDDKRLLITATRPYQIIQSF